MWCGAVSIMLKLKIFLPIFFLLLVPQAVWSQGMAESGGMYGLSAGLGAGLAASRGHGQVVHNSYKALLEAQLATLAQTKAIEKYMTLGCQFEIKKQWENAEKSFRYVLQVVALRDGPGSAKSVPALQHLVTISKAENKLDDAISYQKTVLAFAKTATIPNHMAVLNASINLSNLFMQKEDYANAESVLGDSVTLLNANPSLPDKERGHVCESYINVLHKLHKDIEIPTIVAAGANNAKSVDEKQSTPAAAQIVRRN